MPKSSSSTTEQGTVRSVDVTSWRKSLKLTVAQQRAFVAGPRRQGNDQQEDRQPDPHERRQQGDQGQEEQAHQEQEADKDQGQKPVSEH